MHVGHTTTAVVTGKPLELGGSLGRREATGRGVMIVDARIGQAPRASTSRARRVAVQGFGNVGSVSAELLAEASARRSSRVTDWKGGVYNAKGLDIAEAARLRRSSTRPSTASPAASR